MIVTERNVVERSTLTAGEIAAATELVQAATAQDGVRPLSDQAMLHLSHGGDDARSVLVRKSDTLVGYAHLEPATESGGEPSAELVIHPLHRGRGHGRALAEAVVAAAGGRPRLWAHGDAPAAVALAGALGLVRVRALWTMRRPLGDPLPEVPMPAPSDADTGTGTAVRIRTFEVGRDEQAWLEVNRRAFADHPEQGAWQLDDLLRREREPWFDPAGFFLAERAGRLVGFHWTKVHGDPASFGEVYVVGVDPAAQGGGLGRVLTLVGLHHLRGLGLDHVMLYVDETNTSAVRLYQSLGFTRSGADVMYAAP